MECPPDIFDKLLSEVSDESVEKFLSDARSNQWVAGLFHIPALANPPKDILNSWESFMGWSYELPAVQDWDDHLGLIDDEGEFKHPTPKHVFPNISALQQAIIAAYQDSQRAWDELNVSTTDITCGEKSAVVIYVGSHYQEEWVDTGDCEFSESEGFFPN
jgi:hypothetical protein